LVLWVFRFSFTPVLFFGLFSRDRAGNPRRPPGGGGPNPPTSPRRIRDPTYFFSRFGSRRSIFLPEVSFFSAPATSFFGAALFNFSWPSTHFLFASSFHSFSVLLPFPHFVRQLCICGSPPLPPPRDNLAVAIRFFRFFLQKSGGPRVNLLSLTDVFGRLRRWDFNNYLGP